jgi:hypothetical protein
MQSQKNGKNSFMNNLYATFFNNQAILKVVTKSRSVYILPGPPGSLGVRPKFFTLYFINS